MTKQEFIQYLKKESQERQQFCWVKTKSENYWHFLYIKNIGNIIDLRENGIVKFISNIDKSKYFKTTYEDFIYSYEMLTKKYN